MTMLRKGNKVMFKYKEVDEKAERQIISQFNLLYLLIDVLNSTTYDLERLTKGTKFALREDQKRVLNTLKKACVSMRVAVLEKSSEDTKIQFGDSSDRLYHFIRMVLSRCYGEDDRWNKAFFLLYESMPKMIEIDMTDFDQLYEKTWEE